MLRLMQVVMTIETRYYVTETGLSPFEEWFDTLADQTQTRVVRAVSRFEAGNFGDVKAVGEGVSERRLDFGPGYRLYFGKDGQQVVILLTGGTKKRQQRDIETAKQYWADYKQRKRGEVKRAKATEEKTEKSGNRKKKGR